MSINLFSNQEEITYWRWAWWHSPIIPNIHKEEARGTEVQDQPQLQIKVKASLCYMKPCLKSETFEILKTSIYLYLHHKTPVYCVGILPAGVAVYHLCDWWLWKPQGIRSPRMKCL